MILACQLEFYDPFLNSTCNWTIFKNLKLQSLTLSNQTPFTNPISSSFLVQYEQSLWWWLYQVKVQNISWNSKGNQAMSKDLKLSKSLSVLTLPYLALVWSKSNPNQVIASWSMLKAKEFDSVKNKGCLIWLPITKLLKRRNYIFKKANSTFVSWTSHGNPWLLTSVGWILALVGKIDQVVSNNWIGTSFEFLN
jgi:hypothetical protein